MLSCAALALALSASGCEGQEQPQPPPNHAAPTAFPVQINVPDKLTRIATGERDALGRPVKVACVECHSQREAGTPRSVEELDEFHSGLSFRHGELPCVSCHQPGAHDQLRLASGQSIPLVDVISLCAQCHGPQYRDYKRGAHGGMTGYWDLTKGPRQRNNCVDCHDPHSPAYPSLQPAPPPRSRFTAPAQGMPAHE